MFPVRNCDFVAAGLTGCAATDCVWVPVVGLPDVGVVEPQAVTTKARLTITSIQRTGGLWRVCDPREATEFSRLHGSIVLYSQRILQLPVVDGLLELPLAYTAKWCGLLPSAAALAM